MMIEKGSGRERSSPVAHCDIPDNRANPRVLFRVASVDDWNCGADTGLLLKTTKTKT